MFETLRINVARAISPKAAAPQQNRLNLASALTPGVPIYSEMTVRRASREGYKMSIYIYRGVRTIIQAASAIPWVALDDDGTQLPMHDFTKLMARPNSEFSGQDMIELLIGHLCLSGNGVWQPIMVNSRPREFWPVMPDLVRPIPSDVKGKWLEGYEITESTGVRTVEPETFIHFMQTDPGNPYWGIGPLMAAARTVDTDNEAQDTQKVSMQNRGIPEGILSPTDAALSEEEYKDAQARFKADYQTKAKKRSTWFFNKGMKWEAMSQTAVEMDYINSRLQNKRDISAALGISPIFLGDLDQSSYNNMAEARKALYQDAVIPMLDDIKATLQMKVGDQFGIQVGYDLSNVAALRDDYSKKVASAKTLWDMGVPLSQINSTLEMGIEEFPGWDRSYLPFSLMPAGAPTPEVAPAIEPVKSKTIQAETEEQKAAQWKRIDTRRMGWWAVVGKKITPLYDDMATAIQKALKGKTEADAVRVAQSAIESVSDDWIKTMTAAYTAVIEDIGTQTAQDLGTKPKSAKAEVFDPFTDAAIAWIKRQAASSVKTILATDIEAVRAIILNGFSEGQGIPEIAKLIRAFYDDNSAYKAARVARTEVAKAAGFGQHEAARQSGVVATKRWLTARDSAVRDSHADLEGEEQPLSGNYSNGLEFPGDPSGDAADVINCRCTELYGF